MRRLAVSMFVIGLSCLIFTAGQAGEKGKEVTLKGTVCCPKCELGEAKVCGTVVVVKKDDKEIKYYFDDASNKKYHKNICTEAKKGTVVGTVKVVDKKNIIAVKKVEFE